MEVDKALHLALDTQVAPDAHTQAEVSYVLAKEVKRLRAELQESEASNNHLRKNAARHIAGELRRVWGEPWCEPKEAAEAGG